MKHARLLLTCMLWAVIATALKAQTNLSGSQVGEGTFYLMNVYSGKYLKFGGANNEKAAEGSAGTAITLAKSDNAYTINTNAGFLNSDLIMTSKNSFNWTMTKVDGNLNQYYLKTSNGKGALTSKNNTNGLLGLASYNPDDSKQKWILLTETTLKTAMQNYSDIDTPFDATPLIKAAAFDINDNPLGKWKGLNKNNIITTDDGMESGVSITTNNAKIEQTLSDLPEGTYHLSFEGFYRSTSAKKVQISFGNTTVDIKDNNNFTGNAAEAIKAFASNDEWKNEITLKKASGNLSISILIEGKKADVSFYMDNFVLLYYGENKGNPTVDPTLEYVNNLNNYIAEIQAKVNSLNEAGQKAYDISAVLADRDAGRINSEETLQAAKAAIDAAYAKALAAHEQYIVDNLPDPDPDVTDEFIENAGFGAGDDRFWTINGAVISTNGIDVTGAQGSYLFKGTSIRQDITAANGKYKLTAEVASTNNATVTLTATNESKLTEQSTTLGTETDMKPITIENVIIFDNNLYIQVTGDKEFYVDNFSLSYQGPLPEDPQLKDTDMGVNAAIDFYPTITVTRTLKAETWSTFVVPFDMAIPTGWEVKTLTGSTLNGENISLTFSDASSIEAGVPYMVRVKNATSTITGTNVWLDTELKSTSTQHITFTGTYTNGHVPQGAFFISSNTFYRAADNSNTMKGYRAYLQPTVTNARSLSYRTDGDTAIDNSQLTNDNEATVVAIYNLQGVRLDDMQVGVNILQMSDGRVVKVVIK